VALLAKIFVDNILPTFMVMALGVLLDRKLKIDKKTLSRIAIYVLTPCLVFSSISQSTIEPSQFGIMIVYSLLMTLLMCGVALGVGYALRWPSRLVDALVLSVAFVNAGNFGLPVVLFAFGQPGLDLGTVFFVGSNFTGNTLAAFFAVRSNGSRSRALLQVFKLPGIWGFVLAMLLRTVHVLPPEPFMKAVTLVGRAQVPVMLMMLGVQLSQTQVGRNYGRVAVGVFLRLVLGAAVAFGLAPLLGLQGLARSVGVTQASMPSAVTSALLAVEFEADAEYVTNVIFYSTLLSSLTLTIVLSLVA
jgi:hypothetical protein